MLPVDPPSGTILASVPRREGVSEEEHNRTIQVVQERLRALDRSRPNYARIPIPLPPQISAAGQQPMHHQRPLPNQQPAHQQSRPLFQRPPNQQPRPQRPSYQPPLPNQPRAPNQDIASSIMNRVDLPIPPQIPHNGRQPIYMNQQQPPPFQPQSNQQPYYPQPVYQQPLPNQPPPYQPNQQYPSCQHQNQQRQRTPDMITLQFQPNSLNHIVYHTTAFDENSPRYTERTYNQLARALRGEARNSYNRAYNSTYSSKPIYDPNVSSTSNELPGDT